MDRVSRLLAALVVVAALLPVAAAAADPYPVTSTADSGPGTLRTAIESANAHEGADTIPIEVTGTVGLQTELPTIYGDVSIVGPGAQLLNVRREAAAAFGIFQIGPTRKANFSGLTISNGLDLEGAGIDSYQGIVTLTGVVIAGNEARSVNGAGGSGGGIHNYMGSLTLRDSVVRDNHAVDVEADGSALVGGGGIWSFGELTIEGSTISGNTVFGDAGNEEPAWADGGGMEILDGPITVDRSTISGNSVVSEGSTKSTAKGGGIRGVGATFTSSTVTGNSVTSTGTALGANFDFFGKAELRNTIVAEPLGADSCSGILGSGGFNLDEDGSCQLEAGSDQAEVVSGLDPVLRDNGGPTPTHALLPGSPAVDKGSAFGGSADQRGLPRPVDFPMIGDLEGGDASDIGAFELQFPLPPAGAAPGAVAESPPGPPGHVIAIPADTTPPNTRIVRAPTRVTLDRFAKFRFASTEAQSHFQCKVDGRRWRECRSPYKQRVARGNNHVFKVRAIDRFGNVDPTPARFGWRVKELGR